MSAADLEAAYTTRTNAHRPRHKKLDDLHAAMTPDQRAWLIKRFNDPDTIVSKMADTITENFPNHPIDAGAIRFARKAGWTPAK